jgi:inner membrane protein
LSSEAAHFVVGAALSLAALNSQYYSPALMPRWMIPLSSGILATVPDLDLGWKYVFSYPHSDFLQHRGLFHSPFFLIIFSAALASIVACRRSRGEFAWLWLLWAGCMITHPLLDSLTIGGHGVMLLLPFTTARFYLPWRVLQTATGGDSLLSRAWALRRSEIPFCIAAAIIGFRGLRAARHSRVNQCRTQHRVVR